jgi:hypothetical protein
MHATAIIQKKNPGTNAHGAEGLTNVINSDFIGLAQAL